MIQDKHFIKLASNKVILDGTLRLWYNTDNILYVNVNLKKELNLDVKKIDLLVACLLTVEKEEPPFAVGVIALKIRELYEDGLKVFSKGEI